MKTKKPAKRVPSPAEVANDPSLRWYPLYRQGELLCSDELGAVVRFWAYEGPRVKLASLQGISPLPGTFDSLRVRRP